MLRIGFAASQSPRFLAAENVIENSGVQHGTIQTQGGVERGSNITNALKLLPDPAISQS